MDEITFVTGNSKKLAEMERLLGRDLLNQKLDMSEIQSLDLEEVVAAKARSAFAAIGTPVIVEDTALVFHALGKLPGTFIKWFAEELDYDGLCTLLDDKPDRSATVHACVGYYDGATLQTFLGECGGSIALSPRKGEGFGFDCIFIPEGYDKTWSELPSEVKDTMSHRSRAIAACKAGLQDAV